MKDDGLEMFHLYFYLCKRPDLDEDKMVKKVIDEKSSNPSLENNQQFQEMKAEIEKMKRIMEGKKDRIPDSISQNPVTGNTSPTKQGSGNTPTTNPVLENIPTTNPVLENIPTTNQLEDGSSDSKKKGVCDKVNDWITGLYRLIGFEEKK